MVKYEKKKTYFLLIFTALLLGSSAYFMFASLGDDFDPYNVLSSDEKKKRSRSFLSSVDYFVNEDGAYKIYLNGETLVLYENGITGEIIAPKGRAYTKQNKEIYYMANEGIWDRDTGNIEFLGDVKMETEDSFVEAGRAKYNFSNEILEYEYNVKTKTTSRVNGDIIFIDSDKAISWIDKKRSTFKDNVKGFIKRKLVYEQSVSFSSDILNLDLITYIINLDGRVILKNQGFTAEALRGEIHLKDYNKKLKYYALFDDVKLLQKLKMSKNKTILRRAFAEKLEGIMSENKIILTGNPKVFQGNDVVKGNKIILREESKTVEVDDAITNIIIK